VKLLPIFPEEHQKRMQQILNRYIRTVKPDFQPGSKGWETRKGRTPFLSRIKGKKDEQLYPLWSTYSADSLF
jgi:hypothetical protein